MKTAFNIFISFCIFFFLDEYINLPYIGRTILLFFTCIGVFLCIDIIITGLEIQIEKRKLSKTISDFSSRTEVDISKHSKNGKYRLFVKINGVKGTHGDYTVLFNSDCNADYFETPEEALKQAKEELNMFFQIRNLI